MTPERAQFFLEDLHRSGWTIALGPLYASATHSIWGAELGRGESLPAMLDDLRAQIRKRELCP